MTCTKDTGKINATKCVNKVLQLAKDNEKKPGQIFSDVVSFYLKIKQNLVMKKCFKS